MDLLYTHGIYYIVFSCIYGYNLWKNKRNDNEPKIVILVYLHVPLLPHILLIDFLSNKISERNQERMKMSFVIFMRIVTFPLLILVKIWELVEALVEIMDYPKWWARRIWRRNIHFYIEGPKLL